MADVFEELSFTMEEQTMSNWCWAATAKSTSVFYVPNNGVTQCKVANGVCSVTTCCGSPSNCNDAKKLSVALKVTGNYINHIEAIINWGQIKAEIIAGRLVCARVQWDEGGGHFVAIYGVSRIRSSRKIFVDDPLYGKILMRYERFRDNYRGLGSWSHTYFTNTGNAAN